MKRSFCCLAVLAAVVVLPAFADIVQNGTFQPGPGLNLSFATVTGNTIPGWTVTQGSVDWIGTYWQQPPHGGYSVDLDGYFAAGEISQDIQTTVGQWYVLSFWLAGNPDGPPETKTLKVTTGDMSQNFTYLTPPATHDKMGWTQNSISFQATSATTSIKFTSLDDAGNAFGPVLGDVSVSVPEGSFYSYSAFALGLSGLLMLVRRKRQA